jgi:ribonuclease HI
MKVEVYTDGGCESNGKPGAKAAYGYYFPHHKELSFAARVPDDQPQTNNRGELLGILEGIKKAKSSFPPEEIDLHVFTDSDYAKNCITKWLPGWIAKGWKTSTGQPVMNRDLIEDTSNQLLAFKSYAFTHVRAHTGGDDECSVNNDIVDRMVSKVIVPHQESAPATIVKVKGPLQMMGPPVSETQLYAWCRANLHELDQDAVRVAIISAYSKTMRKNGYEVKKHSLHRTNEYRLIAASNLTTTHTEE